MPDFAAHMFIFYYAVLSEVSPPTALSPFAAAALTGGNPFRTMMLTWKYTLPAFLVPFVFTLRPEGAGILLQGTLDDRGGRDRHRRRWASRRWRRTFGGWIRGPASTPSSGSGLASPGASSCYGGLPGGLAGSAVLALVLVLHLMRQSSRNRSGSTAVSSYSD